jgi:hypothetical protein|tara:strand:- start:3407 stop:3847 length:441 start_codon:yes stop_codon:yes gene_type:complete
MQKQKIYISNRGNLAGKDPDEENKPDYIENALGQGVCVKTDVWVIKDRTVTGTEHPSTGINLNIFDKEKLLVQARNPTALLFLLEEGYHCFWRESDNLIMTNRNFILSYAGSIFPKSIIMLPEENAILTNNEYMGICSDFISGWIE